jgi:large subunit ribosomal protein L30
MRKLWLKTGENPCWTCGVDMAKLEIRLIRSVIGGKPAQRRTVRALGLGKINSKVVQNDNPAIRGMVRVVSHLVEVKEIS